jgi:hypothetical protein
MSTTTTFFAPNPEIFSSGSEIQEYIGIYPLERGEISAMSFGGKKEKVKRKRGKM